MINSVLAFSSICICLGVSGLFLNLYILIIILCSSITSNNILILLLAFTDTFFCFMVIINSILTFFIDPLSFQQSSSLLFSAQTGCKLQGSLWSFFSLCIIWTVCGIIIDRYIAIVKPFNYSKVITSKNVTKFILSIWSFCALLTFFPLFHICHYNYSYGTRCCVITCKPNEKETFLMTIKFTYSIVYCATTLLPLLIILSCNLHILMIARHHHHQIVSAIYDQTFRPKNIDKTHQKSLDFFRQKGGRAVSLIFQLIGSILLLTIPYHGIYFYELFTNLKVNSKVTSLSILMLIATPLVNAYVYGIKSKILRQTFKRVLQVSIFFLKKRFLLIIKLIF